MPKNVCTRKDTRAMTIALNACREGKDVPSSWSIKESASRCSNGRGRLISLRKKRDQHKTNQRAQDDLCELRGLCDKESEELSGVYDNHQGRQTFRQKRRDPGRFGMRLVQVINVYVNMFHRTSIAHVIPVCIFLSRVIE